MSQRSFTLSLPIVGASLRFLSFSDSAELVAYLRMEKASVSHLRHALQGSFFLRHEAPNDVFTLCIVRGPSARESMIHEAVHEAKALYNYLHRREVLPQESIREECIAQMVSALSDLGLHWINTRYKPPSPTYRSDLVTVFSNILDPMFWIENYSQQP